jgi:limonene-1,2-epoxide hydrolase
MADAADSLDVVRRFCATWEKLDIDELMTYFAEDAVYHNIPIDPLVGHEAIRGLIETFTAGMDRVVFEIRHAVADGNVVLTERMDRFVAPNIEIALPVMGTFELDGDKIVAWRDYFDMNQYMSQLPTG